MAQGDRRADAARNGVGEKPDERILARCFGTLRERNRDDRADDDEGNAPTDDFPAISVGRDGGDLVHVRTFFSFEPALHAVDMSSADDGHDLSSRRLENFMCQVCIAFVDQNAFQIRHHAAEFVHDLGDDVLVANAREFVFGNIGTVEYTDAEFRDEAESLPPRDRLPGAPQRNADVAIA